MLGFLKRLFNPPVFEVKLKAGAGHRARGKVSGAFIQECIDICEREGLDSISVFGVRSEHGIRLEFSTNVPKSTAQKFRNVWELYR